MKSNISRILQRGVAIALIVAAAVAASSCAAEDSSAVTSGGGPGSNFESDIGEIDGKEEVIYASLTAGGEVDALYAVNILNISKPGAVTDWGEYSEVENLTDTREITAEGDKLALIGAGRVYYQGAMTSSALPWDFEIAYALDGAPASPEEMAGVSGRAEITVKSAANGDIDPYFAENYLLQISISLDTALCADISAPGATQANAGRNKLLTYTVMPGANADIRVVADVTGFELAPIEITAVPFSMSFEISNITGLTGQFAQLTDGVAQLADGARKLGEGARELADGVSDFADGAAEFDGGMRQLAGSSSPLVEGSEQIMGALGAIAGGMSSSGAPDLSQVEQLFNIIENMAASLDRIKTSLTELETSFALSRAVLDAEISAIPDSTVTEEQIAALYAAAPGQAGVIDALAAGYSSARAVRALYANVKSAFDAVSPTIIKAADSAGSLSTTLRIVLAQASGAAGGDLSGMADQFAQLISAISQLNEQYGGFHSGLVSYTGGVAELSRASGALSDGAREIAGGAATLAGDGVPALTAGIDTLKEETDKIPGKIDEQINELMDGYGASDAPPVSFTSPKNTGVTSVQFVIRTQQIAIPAPPPPPAAPPTEETFFTRLADLFG